MWIKIILAIPLIAGLLASTAWADVKVITGTTNTEDAPIASGGNADLNYGGQSYGAIYFNQIRILLRVKNVATELGENATITSAVCSLYCFSNSTDGDIAAYRVFKPWVEGTQEGGSDEPGATWNDWDNDDWEWGTAGCESADDGGSDNSGDGTGADRKATAEDTETVTTINTWYAWSVANALAQGWYDGTIEEEGIILIGIDDVYNSFRLSEHATAPFWTFTYTVDGAPAANTSYVRRIKEGESK